MRMSSIPVETLYSIETNSIFFLLGVVIRSTAFVKLTSFEKEKCAHHLSVCTGKDKDDLNEDNRSHRLVDCYAWCDDLCLLVLAFANDFYHSP